MDTGVIVRPVEARDVAFILNLERSCFADGWGRVFLPEMLARRSTVGNVVAVEGTVCGYSIYRRVKVRRNGFEFRKLFLDFMAVVPECRRSGLGTLLALEMLENLDVGRPMAETYVRERDLASQLFLRSCGWIATGLESECGEEPWYRMVFRNAWTDNWLETYRQRRLTPDNVDAVLGTG